MIAAGTTAGVARVPDVTSSYTLDRPPLRERLAYQLRVLRVIAGVGFKLKYVDSALGYVWSLAKPLSYFGVLWIVFGRFFDTGISDFPLYLLIGIVLFMYVVDAVGMAMPSIVERGSLLRRIAFPPIVIPLSASVTAGMTFCVNLLAVAVFVVFSGVTPGLDWALLPLLLLELYVFTVGLALLISTLFVRFRDIGPMWELVAQLLLFASPIMYPITILPDWAERIALLNPFVQVLQDVRTVVLGHQAAVATASTVVGTRLIPIAIALATVVLGLVLYRRESPRFAEMV
jgi:ABC-2 type transport system permease protein